MRSRVTSATIVILRTLFGNIHLRSSNLVLRSLQYATSDGSNSSISSSCFHHTQRIVIRGEALNKLQKEHGRESIKMVGQADHSTVLKQVEEHATKKKNRANKMRLKY
ncbi:hypothetical protein BCON_0011g00320 [Botryotinia convoluta]|uniref:Uncharacterized protein n=1 Tax=Botryotinia convoluta TaxID=54673 RepID=A0A4Z1IQC9_9HELO|nr:hypothetical protein BCON_0011g00320 [Botryotinia convoluta]